MAPARRKTGGLPAMNHPVVLGIGCDRGTELNTLETAVKKALSELDLDFDQVVAFATIDKKQDELCMRQLAEKYRCPLHFFPAEQLATVEVPSPSAVVLKYMGTPSVSEAAAILAANSDASDLLLEKYKYRGEDDKNATVSIVRMRKT
jgi:cobalt-precorrin 5A hydrolase